MDIMDVIIYGGIALFVVGSWIWNQVRETAEARQQQLDEATDPETVARQQQLAAQRREELEQARAQRAAQLQGGGATAAQSSAQPGNLSAREQMARELARVRYEQRAKEMRERQAAAARQTQTSRQTPPRSSSPPPPPRASAPQTASRPAAQMQQARPTPPRATPPQPARRTQPPHRTPPPQRTQPPQRSQQPQRQAATQAPRSQESIHATAIGSGADPFATDPREIGGPSEHAALSPQDLRRAVILREIFDRPVGMRQSTHDVNAF